MAAFWPGECYHKTALLLLIRRCKEIDYIFEICAFCQLMIHCKEGFMFFYWYSSQFILNIEICRLQSHVHRGSSDPYWLTSTNIVSMGICNMKIDIFLIAIVSRCGPFIVQYCLWSSDPYWLTSTNIVSMGICNMKIDIFLIAIVSRCGPFIVQYCLWLAQKMSSKANFIPFRGTKCFISLSPQNGRNNVEFCCFEP